MRVASIVGGRLGQIGTCGLLILALATAAFRGPGEDGVFARIVKSLVGFYGNSLSEKAYLHLDRPFYARGETVWLAAYVVEADSHRPDTLSKVLYVELLSARQQLVAQRTLRLRGGLAHADLALPDTLPAGTYQLRAYTSWMRNAGEAFFFRRPLVVVGPTPAPPPAAGPLEIDVQFFPEGGNLVAGLESTIGFKAVDGRGHGIDVQGTVLDAQRRPVASFGSRHLGMGSFQFTPAAGQQYHAVLALPGGQPATYPLPASQPTGYALRVSETADDFVVVVRRQLPAGAAPGGPAILLAQVRGKVAYAAQVPLTGATPVTARLPKTKFPAGLAHLTLFDEQGVAQCERLVCVPNPPGVRLTLTPDKPAYLPHEAVHLRLAATDAAGQPVAGQFSVAVAAASPDLGDGPTIVSHLLLSSDLAGVVEDPGYYFREPQNPEIRLALNDLLLTQGWRRFVWKELLAGQLPGRDYAPEQGLSVSGQVLTVTGQPAASRQVDYLQSAPAREAHFLTDATGHFRFRGLDGLDTTHLLLRAQPAKGEKELRISLLAPPASTIVLPSSPPLAGPALASYLSRGQSAASRQPAADQAVALQTVRVRGQQAAPADNNARPYTTRNAIVLRVGDQVKPYDSRTILQYMQGRVAGVAVTGDRINIRQASSLQDQSTGGFQLKEPLYLIDGAVVPADVFTSYPIKEIQTIDVMNQNAAGIFGSQGYGGVLAAYTRQDGYTDPQAKQPVARRGAVAVQIPGYYQAREFYAPRYPAATTPAPPDPRYATLYWLPEVRTDATGQALVSFFTADAGGTFQATAEGLTAQGTPLRGSATLVVQERASK